MTCAIKFSKNTLIMIDLEVLRERDGDDDEKIVIADEDHFIVFIKKDTTARLRVLMTTLGE